MSDIRLILLDGTSYLVECKTPDHFEKMCREAEKGVFVKVPTYRRDARGYKYGMEFRMISKYAMKELEVVRKDVPTAGGGVG